MQSLVKRMNKFLDRQEKMTAYFGIKALNGEFKSEVRKAGDEIEVTSILKIQGCEFVGKATASGSKFENCQEVNAIKREACMLAFNKWVEANKSSGDGMSKDDMDRRIDSWFA